MTAGRPTKFTVELGDKICKLIAEGNSLNVICKTVEDVPYISTVLGWVLDGEASRTEELANFTRSYTRSMEIRTEYLAGQVIDIADYKGNDIKTDAEGNQIFNEQGNPVIDHDNVQRSKLQIETRLKYIAFLKPKKYGTQVTNKLIGGDDDQKPINTKLTVEFIRPKPVEDE